MELRQLAYFVTVAEEANFTRAAAKLHVAQPGVSAQIRRLERELGQELLDRTSRSVRLTEVGEAVLPYARAALAAVDGVRLAVDEMTGLVRGRVAIGMVTSHDVDMPTLLAEFHQDHPGVEITLAEAPSHELIESLLDGRLDAAIVAVGEEVPPGLALHTVTEQRIVAAVALDHAMAKGETVRLADLREQVLISLPRGTGIRSILDRACAAAGFAPHAAFEAGSPVALAELAARGLGIAVIPEGLARSRPDLHTLAIVEPVLRGGLAFAWRTDGPMSPAARALVGRALRLLGE
ncbi:LysR substrate-binding domain-containing protein [Streptomyces sp. NPDC046215]|uniref:LysR substrate-binding domain-containing protein n=1 Tax=Streptomyces stramineus TaxID=173861 RepID=A0ABP3L0H4_9ACTN